ncbi:uncharacterized protein DUF4249 [Arcicella aurantiaca]|uniref:Uncharacterized protein DUF4249 n=1 Tax=Arcicella aurantiaca TaxID=591202 RepID=A0A316E6S3_9BACT|nr:DUF4249 family protein [Arcicella aurantiaca]PWK26417.1 uncharacterized protein DUF4249 [Arcicella aurantiaca]
MKKILTYISFILAFSSCKSLVTDIDIPYSDRLVVQCFLSPQDTLIEVSVTQTAPVIGDIVEGAERYPNIPNATVVLSDGQKSVTIPYLSKQLPSSYDADGEYVYTTRARYYLSTKNFPIITGKTYSLRISAPNFPSVQSSCSIPVKVVAEKNISATQEILAGTDRRGNPISYPSIGVKFVDIPNEESFYSVGQFFYQKGTYKDASSNTKLRINWTTKYEYIADKGQENQTLLAQAFDLKSYNNWGTFGGTGNNGGGGGPNGGGQGGNNLSVTPTEKYVEIYVANTDKAYYYYNTAIDKIRKANGNPFAEPVLTYSNIENGLGVMAGYNQSRIVVKVP